MPTFALITEGVTDQVVLERLIEDVCSQKFGDDIYVNPIQPVRDETDSHTAPHAGWGLVFEACTEKSVLALDANDFLVIQIDTDCGDDPAFGLALTEGGVDRCISDLISDAKSILASKIGTQLYIDNAHRICFAICVHSIESWLLMLAFHDKSTKNGEYRLDRILRKKNDNPLVKTEKYYRNFWNKLPKNAILRASGEENSFSDFVSQLQSL